MSSSEKLLTEALLFSLDGHANPVAAAVRQQESEGQAQMTQGVLLPQNIHRGSRADLEAMGVVFGKPEDELFVRVQLPEGWRIQSTTHSMHSDLLDDQGRKRAGLFYKAAFYDRKADLSLVPRFSLDGYSLICDAQGQPDEAGSYRQMAVCQDGKPIHVVGRYEGRDWQTEDALRKTGETWLDTHWPNWRQVTAYWDTPSDALAPVGPSSLVAVANHFLDTRDDLLEDDEVIERDMDEATALEVIRREFVSGTCQAFAVVLHDHLALPIVRVAGGLHMAVQQPDGTLVDFMGAFTPAQIDQRYGTRHSPVQPVSRDEALAAFVLDADDDQDHDPWSDLNVARWVRQTLDRWTPDMTPAVTRSRRRRQP